MMVICPFDLIIKYSSHSHNITDADKLQMYEKWKVKVSKHTKS